MKYFLGGITVAALLFTSGFSRAAESADVKTELEQIVKKIEAKANAGQEAEAEYAEELGQLDALLARHQTEKTDSTAEIVLIQVGIYAQVFLLPDKAKALLEKLKSDFPKTAPGQRADSLIAMIDKDAAEMNLQRSLRVGAIFPDFHEKDLEGKPLSLANYKGKIVLVEFWATWCGICVAEMPQVVSAYAKFHDRGFEIVGISLDSEKARLTKFIAEKQMPWPQYFDGLEWDNKLAARYGVRATPATFLLDREGRILARNLRGAELDAILTQVLGGK